MDKKHYGPSNPSNANGRGFHPLELLEQLKPEYEMLLQEVTTYKSQKEDLEKKFQAQLGELNSIQQVLRDMERNYNRMRQQFEDELIRARRGVDKVPESSRDQQSFPSARNMIPNDGMTSVQTRDASGSPDIHYPQGSRNQRNPQGAVAETLKENRSRTPTVEEAESKNEPGRYGQSAKDDSKAFAEKRYRDGIECIITKNPGASGSNIITELAHTMDHSSVVCCVKFSSDGKYLATGCNKSAQIYDVDSGEKINIFSDDLLEVNGTRKEGDLYIRSVCFSPDGRYLAAGAEDRTVKVWDINNRRTKHVFSGHELDIYSLDFSPDGRIIVSGSGDRKTKVWNLEKAELLHTLHGDDTGPRDGVTSVSISSDGRLVACGSLDRVVRIWDLQTGHLKDRLEGHEDSVYSVAFSPDGTRIASGSLDTTVKIWDIGGSRSHRSRAPITLGTPAANTAMKGTNGHKDFVLSVAFSPDGNWLLSGSKDRTVRFWELRQSNWNTQLQGHKNSVISVAVNPKRGLFATGSGDYRARLWKYSIG